MNLVWATPAEAAELAQAHAGGFDAPWAEDAFEDLLDGDGVFAFLARDDDGAPAGMVLGRVAASEMEILTLAVAGSARRRGVAKALMTAALGAARQAGAQDAFLEVAVDNAAAVALYESLGYRRAGLRRGYYDRGPQGLADALVMRLDLAGQAP